MEELVVSPLRAELISRGHHIIKDVMDPSIVAISQLELVPFLRTDEKEISVHELRRRAKTLKANFGQMFSDLVYAKQNELLETWHPYHLLSPGTLWEGENRDRGVSELYWYENSWRANYVWVGFKLDARYRLLKIKIIPGLQSRVSFFQEKG